MLDPALLTFMKDSVTIEPWLSESSGRVPTYGAAVTYRAMVLPWQGRAIKDKEGREFVPAAVVAIEGRVSVDNRSRVTLPSDMLVAGTRTPPIRAVQPGPASDLSLDYTMLMFNVLLLALPFLAVAAYLVAAA